MLSWRWTFSPLQFARPSAPGTPALPQDSLHALPPVCLLLGLQLSPHQATHRMWSTLDLPLLRNIYSVLFTKYESLSCHQGASNRQGYWGRNPSAPSSPPRKSQGESLLCQSLASTQCKPVSQTPSVLRTADPWARFSDEETEPEQPSTSRLSSGPRCFCVGEESGPWVLFGSG